MQPFGKILFLVALCVGFTQASKATIEPHYGFCDPIGEGSGAWNKGPRLGISILSSRSSLLRYGANFNFNYMTLDMDKAPLLDQIGLSEMGMRIFEVGFLGRIHTPSPATRLSAFAQAGVSLYHQTAYATISGRESSDKEISSGVSIGGGAQLPLGASLSLTLMPLWHFLFGEAETTKYLSMAGALGIEF